MREWHKDLEKLLGAYKSGDLERMDKDLNDLLQPFDISDRERMSEQWHAMREYERHLDGLRKAALYADQSEDDEVREASELVIGIRRKVKAKKEYAKENLEDAVAEAQNEVIKAYDEDPGKVAVKDIRNMERRVGDAARLAKEYGFTSVHKRALKTRENIEKHIDRVLEDREARKESETRYEKIIREANDVLKKSTSTSDLESMRTRLSGYNEASDLSWEQERNLDVLVDRYKRRIGELQEHRRRRTGRFLGNMVKTIAVAGGLYLGYIGVRAAAEGIDEKVAEVKEERAEKLGVEQAEEEAASYEAAVAERKRELSQVEESVEYQRSKLAELQASEVAKRERLSSLEEEVEEERSQHRNITTSSSVATRLDQIVNLVRKSGSLNYILYIEKSSNQSYLLDESGDVLMNMKHTDGRGGDKKRRGGDKCTPEGTYRINRHYFYHDGSESELFGRGFYRINYPTSVERRKGYTGGGILLCSTPSWGKARALDLGRDVTNGGVMYKDDVFEKLHQYIGSGSGTLVAIEDAEERPANWGGRR
ncbi:L,D-transpeptidase family protein [Candidatus Woesearchaeota archaeon]|nr:L,D-transpeptidase family protein [Candidatus Woesearchaeota archaeon]